MSYPVCSPSWENVADDGTAVSAPTDAKAKSVAVIGQHNHLDLSPVTLKLKFKKNKIFSISVSKKWVQNL